MASRNVDYIEKLLLAEEQGRQAVEAAEASRAALLRRAKEKAQREIDAFTKEKEKELESLRAKNAEKLESLTADLRKQVDEEVARLEEYAAAHREEVSEMLLRVVLAE